MKLTELAIDGIVNNQSLRTDSRTDSRKSFASGHLRVGKFSDGLSLVYGESGAGKSTVRRFIRDTLLGLNQSQGRGSQIHASSGQIGHLGLFAAGQEIQLARETAASPLQVRSSSGHSAAERESVRPTLDRLNPDLYETVFNVSFRDTPSNLYSLSRVLQTQFAVPSGPGAAGDDSALLQWQRETGIKNERLETLRKRIEQLESEKADLNRQAESARAARQSQVAERELQINQVVARINELQYASVNEQVVAVDREINQLQLYIDNAKPQVNYVATETRELGESPLYRRLDYLEDQIRRWRKIQTDVQDQRVKLRDQMLVWNEMTLDSDKHPYHNARRVLIDMEARVDEAERNAKHWAEADIDRVDATQLGESLEEICGRLREDVYGLCNELSHQYKHIRHKSAAFELKQLREYYTEMGDNVEELTALRNGVIGELRTVDPEGAEAICRADANFMQCAIREGYLAARVKFVGPLTHQAPQPTYHAPDLTSERARLAALQLQRSQYLGSFGRVETELSTLNAKHTELISQRDQIAATAFSTELELKIQTITSQLAPLHGELAVLLRELEELRNFVPPQPNRLIQRAASLLNQITEGDLSQVFLGDAVIGAHGKSQIELQVRDRVGKVLNASAIDAGLQDQVYLSLMLACQEQLAGEGIDLPVVIDDAFNRIPPTRVTATLRLLNEVGVNGKQIIALTQHRYLADRLPGVYMLELSQDAASSLSSALPPSHSLPVATATYVPPVSVTPYTPPLPAQNLKPSVEYVVADSVPPVQFASPSILSEVQLDFSVPVSSSSFLPRPYPLSKYPHSTADAQHETGSSTVAYPFPQTGIVERTAAATHSVSSVAVEQFADPMGFAVPINEDTLLRKVGLFEGPHLRTFESQNLESVADLISIDESEASQLGVPVEQLERWHGQLCLLMTVPGMRINDSRILIACGVFEPEQLDTSHPQQLFERVERFLGTTEGRRFSTNYEPISLERISAWYRALDATRSTWQNRTRRQTRLRSRKTFDSSRGSQSDPDNQRDGRSYMSNTSRSAGEKAPRADRERATREPRIFDREPRIYDRDSRQRTQRSAEREPRSDRRETREREPRQFEREPRQNRETRQRETRQTREPRSVREPRMQGPSDLRSRTVRSEQKTVPRVAPISPASLVAKEAVPVKRKSKTNSEVKLKFYLDLNDHIEAAPSIGPKAAERFEKININTVSDFLKQTAESISTKLNYKRMSEAVIREWQHQARLICRVPNLRGHDAQLLVACGITEPEEFSTMQPKSLFEIIGPFSETKEGLKIIRNGKKPDLAEITDWISWAGHTRSLRAA